VCVPVIGGPEVDEPIDFGVNLFDLIVLPVLKLIDPSLRVLLSAQLVLEGDADRTQQILLDSEGGGGEGKAEGCGCVGCHRWALGESSY
jgi:hypothetical protein